MSLSTDHRFRHYPPRPDERPLFRPRKELPLTEWQAKVLKHISDTIELCGQCDSAEVMGRLFRVTAESVVSVLRALQRKGYIEMDGRKTKTLTLTGKRP